MDHGPLHEDGNHDGPDRAAVPQGLGRTGPLKTLRTLAHPASKAAGRGWVVPQGRGGGAPRPTPFLGWLEGFTASPVTVTNPSVPLRSG